MKSFWVLKGLKILILIVFFIVLVGTIVMWLWNWLMPSVFNLPYISFQQAIGLTVLTRLLSGGFHFGMGNHREHWEQKRQMWDKWSAMSSEERQKWKNDWRSRCQHSRRTMGFKSSDEEIENDHI
jgi:hypothetical protein